MKLQTQINTGRAVLQTQSRRYRCDGLLAVLALSVSACSAPGPGVKYKDTGSDGSIPNDPNANLGTGGSSNLPGSGPDNVPPPSPGGTRTDVLLDDFNDGDGAIATAGFAGRWRTYSDGTGSVTPVEDANVVPAEGAIHVSGTGFSDWGVGLTVDLNSPAGQRQPIDLSGYRGLSIRARGTGSLAVEIVTPATTGADEGGTCTGDGCFGHYAAQLTLDASYADEVISFTALSQPDWAQDTALDLTRVVAVNFLARADGGDANIDLWIDSMSLLAAPSVSNVPTNPVEGPGVVTPVTDGTNPFAGRSLHSDSGSAFGAYNSAQGPDRDLLGKIALNPSAFWLVGGDGGRAGGIVSGAGGEYTVIVAYNIPNRDCSGQSAGGASSPAEYQGWIDAMSTSLQGKEAAVILEPDALALSCGASTESLMSYAVNSLRRNPGVAVYVDGGHSNWVPAGEMANRLRSAGIEQATGFAVNVSNFQPTDSLISYGKSLSALLGNKPFIVDTSRNGQGARGDEWCNPAGAGLGEAPTSDTGDSAVHALLWVKRPGESDGACGQCAGTPAGQFCTGYALELARNAAF